MPSRAMTFTPSASAADAALDILRRRRQPCATLGAVTWGGARLHEQSREISLICFVEISVSTTEHLGEISSVSGVIFAFTPNSAAAERVFSLLKSMFGDQQINTLAEIIQAALMLRVNKRTVG